MITAAGFGLRLLLLLVRGFALAPALARSDVAIFGAWILALELHGTQAFYATTAGVDYVPGYLLVLALLGKLYAPLAAHDPGGRILQSLVRLPAILADVALIAAVAAFARQTGSSLRPARILAFSPALLLLTSYWGQVDAIAAALLVLALLASYRNHVALSWFIFAVALVVKPQPLVAGPVLLLWQIYRKQWSAIAWAPLMTAVLCYVVSLPFTALRSPLAVWAWFLDRYVQGISKYPYGSVNAFNLWGFFGRIYTPDSETFAGLPIRLWGLAIFMIILAAVLYRLAQLLREFPQPQMQIPHVVMACAIILFALFMVTTRMHERYAFVALALCTLAISPAYPRLSTLALAFHATFLINCLFTLAGLHDRFDSPLITVITQALSALNLLLFGLVVQSFAQTQRGIQPALES